MSDEVQEREVARRVFAAEFDDATLSYSESDEERAPNYVVTPTGARVNRLFAVGALTEVERVNDDVLRGRIADPTGAFVTYAGQYQPDAAGFLERATPPCFVSITGKGRTYQPEDSDRIFTSVRPESLTEVDADTRDRWVVAAAEDTLDRLATMAVALELDARDDELRAELESHGVDAAHASGVARAIDHYQPTEQYLEAVRRLAVQALQLVAGDRDTVETLDVAPDETGPDELGPLPEGPAASAASSEASTDFEGAAAAASGAVAPAEPTGSASTADATGDESTADTTSGASGAEPAGDASTTNTTAAEEITNASSTESAGDTSAVESEEGAERGGDASAPSPSEDSTAIGSDHSTSQSSGGADPVDAATPEGGDARAPAEDGDSATAETDNGPVDDDLGDFGTGGGDDAEMYELDDDERAEIESEYSTEFATGNEVDDPGEADIDVPDVEDLEAEATAAAEADAGTSGEAAPGESDPASDAATDPTPEPEGATADSGVEDAEATTADAGTEEASAGDVDIEAAAVDVMSDLDDGDGAAREAVVAAVVDEYGVDPDAVESAIQDALMGGKCYEPAEDRLKAI